MESLRTRKASTSGPNGAKRPARLVKPSKDARKSRVDDKIKKRMSTRYADISAPTGLSVPEVPTIPIGLRPGPQKSQEGPEREQRPSAEDIIAAENKLLDIDDFDSDACARSIRDLSRYSTILIKSTHRSQG